MSLFLAIGITPIQRNQKILSSRRFLGGKRLFWLSFVLPCLGEAQDAGLGRISDTILSKDVQDGASDLSSMGREHYQKDKENLAKDTTDCVDLPRLCDKCGLEPAGEPRVVVKEAAALEIEANSKTAAKAEEGFVIPKMASIPEGSVIGVQVPTPDPECYAEPKPPCQPCAPVQCPPSQTCTSVPVPVVPPISSKLCSKDRDCWPGPNGSIKLEFLYFKAILENLRYGAKYPFQVEHPNYTIANIEQPFKYDPGGRVMLGFTLDNYWELDLTWTYFEADPGAANATDPQQILTFMNTSLLGTTGASASNSLHGKWNMTMNVVNANVKKPFCIGNILMFAPSIGAQAALFDHKLNVTYPGTTNTSGSTIPQNISGTNKIWAVGPEIAIESRFLARRKFDLYLRGAYSALLGNFMAKIHYTNMVNPTAAEPVEVRDNSTAVFSMVQIQAAISKRWQVGNGLIELAAGWETQVWSGINRWDYYSTVNTTSVAGNLMLAGPFIKFFVSF